MGEKRGQTRPAVEQEFVEVFDKVDHDFADLFVRNQAAGEYDIVVRDDLQLAANSLDDAEKSVKHVDVVSVAASNDVLHHCWPLDIVLLKTYLHQA